MLLFNRFKHNTSFVSRFSTIRRSRKSSTHSPLARAGRYNASGSEPGTRDDSIVGTGSVSGQPPVSRIPGSVSEDSVVVKEISDLSKRNGSDGK